jgi:hypothetical protein
MLFIHLVLVGVDTDENKQNIAARPSRNLACTLEIGRTTMDNIRNFVTLARQAERITALEDVSWETKYGCIFSVDISQKILETGLTPDYYDPDGSYEDDIKAYVQAIIARAEEYEKILACAAQETD